MNFGNIYCKTTALGNIKSCKPDFMSWQEYTVFLLESIGIYNRDLMLHYYRKIKKFMIWHKNKFGIEVKDIPDKVAPPEMQLLKHSIEEDGYTQPIIRLKQITGLKEMFANHEFSKSWEEFEENRKKN